MKILVAGQDPSLPGGMAKYVGGLLTYLDTVPGMEVDFFNETRVKGRRGMSSATLFTAACEFGVSLRAFKHALKLRRPDAVHLHMAHGLSVLEKSLMAAAAAGRGIPAVVHLHGAGLENTLAALPPWRRLWLRKTLAPPNHVVVLSEGMAELIARHLPGVSAAVIPNAVLLVSPPPPLHSPATFGFIGFMDGRKGESDLIRALAMSENKTSALVLAGDGPARPTAQALTQTLGLKGHVHFLGNIDGAEKDAFFRGIDVLCLPSAAENLPIALLEAMAYGRPVITTPVGAIPELITDGSQGWLVPVGDIEALAAALTEASSRPGEVARRGQAAWDRVADGYTWECSGPKVTALYDAVQHNLC